MIKHLDILRHAKSIGVVRTDRLGDMVLTLPLCNAIKQNLPGAMISMIARSYTKPLLRKSPVLDNYFFIDEFKNGIDDIFKHNRFNVVFFPRPRFEEVYAAYKSDINLRIGSGYRLYSFMFNHRVYEHRKSSGKHEAELNTGLLESVLKEEVETELVKPYIDLNDLKTIEKYLTAFNVTDKQFFIIHPGSGGSAHDWGAKNFSIAAKFIRDKYGLIPLISGIESEAEKCKIAEENCPGSINLCGILSLSEMMALIGKSRFLIANSTGILHIAAAMDVPVIGLYPNTLHLSQKRWGPYSDKAIVLNPPNSDDPKTKDDMSLITIKQALTAVGSIL